MSAAQCLHILGRRAFRLGARGVRWQPGHPTLLSAIQRGRRFESRRLHSLRLLQVWTGRAGGNYRHSASHLAEELWLQNGPALLTLDWAQIGSKQERHSAEDTHTHTHTHTHTQTNTLSFTRSLNHMHMRSPPYRGWAYARHKFKREFFHLSNCCYMTCRLAQNIRTNLKRVSLMHPPTRCWTWHGRPKKHTEKWLGDE